MRGARRTSAHQQGNMVEFTQEERRELFTGPLPHPDILIRYNEAHPGLADRIVTMAEKQLDHRNALESLAIRSEVKRSYAGLWLAFVLCICIVIGATFLLAIGRSIEGYASLLIAAGGIATIFVYVNNSRKAERIWKAQIMAGRAGKTDQSSQ